MDNNLSVVASPEFVINVVQDLSGTAGFSLSVRNDGFIIGVDLGLTTENGAMVGEEYTLTEKNKLAGIETGAKDDLTGAEIKPLYEGENDTNAYDDAAVSKLAAIENSATADQTGGEIKTLYELEGNTNAYTDTEKSKLAGIMVGATDDLTGAEIKTLYENEADTNAFNDAAVSKLAGIDTGAKDDQTGAEIKSLYESENDTNAYNDAAVSKLAGIEDNATADQTDSQIETAYNAQVAKISAGEITAGTEATVRRVSPADLKAIVLAHETGGGGGDPNPDQVSGQEMIDGTETALRSFSPDNVENMIGLHATGTMSDAAIKAAYENNADTNVHSDAQVSKLAGIEAGAKDDQTDAEIRTAVEAASDSNVFTDADHTKLNGIAAGAEVNVADVDYYDLGMDFLGKPTDAQVIARWVVLREITMAADFSGAGGNINTNPTGALVIDIKDDGSSIGTISIATNGVFTFTTISGTEKVVAAGSIVTAVGPGTADATGEDIVFTLPGVL